MNLRVENLSYLPQSVFSFNFSDRKIRTIFAVVNPDKLKIRETRKFLIYINRQRLGVVYRNLKPDAPIVELAIAYQGNNLQPTLQAFLEIVKQQSFA